MAKRKAKKASSKAPTVEDLAAECLIAFGQGTHHSLCVGHDAIAVLRKHFQPRLKKHLRNWDRIADSTLGHARHLGSLAAQLAAKDGSMIVSKKHAAAAIKLKPRDKICAICP